MNIKIAAGIYEQCAELWAEYFYRYHFESDNVVMKIVQIAYSVIKKGRKKKFPKKSTKINGMNNFSYVSPSYFLQKVQWSLRFHYSFPCYLHNFPRISWIITHLSYTHPPSNSDTNRFFERQIRKTFSLQGFSLENSESSLSSSCVVYRDVNMHCSECC